MMTKSDSGQLPIKVGAIHLVCNTTDKNEVALALAVATKDPFAALLGDGGVGI